MNLVDVMMGGLVFSLASTSSLQIYGSSLRWAHGHEQRQHQAAALAQQEHELLNILLTHIDASVYIKDRQGRYLYANPATLVNLGVAVKGHASIVGLTDFDLLPLDVAQQLQQFDHQVLEQGGPLRREERLPKPDGR
jgi:PAS domain-containing protein